VVSWYYVIEDVTFLSLVFLSEDVSHGIGSQEQGIPVVGIAG